MKLGRWNFYLSLAVASSVLVSTARAEAPPKRPNIIFVMADDMGWGETSYRNHPVLKTPNLDAMAANGLRFDRFYAGCPVCSPTRASVLTGRANDRTGVLSHGYALRLQEKTIAPALAAAGYVTGHFGKWHLDGLKGPGVPILPSDPRSPGAFGFEYWTSVTNYFDLDPILSRQGNFTEFRGDSCDIAVAEAVRFLEAQRAGGKPMFAVVWFGSPHSPFRPLPEDCAAFAALDDESARHYGELVALDRSVGVLRRKLRELNIADDTLLVFCSDNGGLPKIVPETVGGLRGNKGAVYEGGLRVPGIVEWPAMIRSPRVTKYPASTMDLFPTVADILGLSADVMIQPIDGASLQPLFAGEIGERTRPIPFRFDGRLALVDNRYKMVNNKPNKDPFALYDLEADPAETRDIAAERPTIAERMKSTLLAWNESVDASFAGKDYPEGRLKTPDPEPIAWTEHPDYAKYLSAWRQRPEYGQAIKSAQGKKK